MALYIARILDARMPSFHTISHVFVLKSSSPQISGKSRVSVAQHRLPHPFLIEHRPIGEKIRGAAVCVISDDRHTELLRVFGLDEESLLPTVQIVDMRMDPTPRPVLD